MLIVLGTRGEIKVNHMDDDAIHTEPVDELATAAAPVDAPVPFNKSTADVILRSSDGVDFRVKKAIIAEASTFFESLFTLPRLQAASDEYRDGLPVIPMTEDKNTLEKLLRIFYPVRDPDIDLHEIAPLLDAARKYDIDVVMDVIMRKLEASYAKTAPLKAYAVAVHFHLTSEAVEAARYYLDEEMEHVPLPEFDNISASAYIRLLNYHAKCGEAASGLAKKFRWIDSSDDWVWFECTSCPGASMRWYLKSNELRTPRTWWLQHMERSADLLKETQQHGNLCSGMV
ncbi:uncharacterized protein LAESUDRAFT_699242 [Laetiporus sulphureus 93-53]|uniref:BTB domain-containing protein n=1 Tax=Laetiporus sulphureus 93-53 TaxID=1314785 RepID=A0A165ELT8_9APHY|nr:uncharacterized protein LAESUDRAFT_699242 [Laetiporus sulphureus 93-53]KZT07325.1 hypothetical protein LAESUDRAFT_699242 [Laetiporus sulphureus 93-53]